MKKNVIKIFLFVEVIFLICMSPLSVYATDNSSDEQVKLYDEYVIVLDSGHDAYHNGAQGNGIIEEDVNFVITEYCKAELEKYENITVYLTHEDMTCPYPGTEANECNKSRCEFAASVNADLFISIHANNNPDRSRRGFEIIYPNTHYKEEFNTKGEILSNYIVEQINKTGLPFREIWTRDSDENKKNDENFYPDGSRADYYNVIRNCKYNDILAIIIEHGYLSNKKDAKEYLSTKESLKAFGEADAKGIINYLISIEKADEDAKVKALIRTKINEIKEIVALFKKIF